MPNKSRQRNPYRGSAKGFSSQLKGKLFDADRVMVEVQQKLAEHPEFIISTLIMIRDSRYRTDAGDRLKDPTVFAQIVKQIERYVQPKRAEILKRITLEVAVFLLEQHGRYLIDTPKLLFDIAPIRQHPLCQKFHITDEEVVEIAANLVCIIGRTAYNTRLFDSEAKGGAN